jgi:lipopolysaccharide transport system permease protein
MLALLKDVYAHRELLFILVARNMKIRYKRSVLGFFWTLLNPLFLILIYAVFLKILKFYDPNNPNFLPMLVSGIIAWQFTSMAAGDSLHAILGNANLITKTSFPRIILPLAMVIANLINFLFSVPILWIYLIVVNVPIGHTWLLPFIVLTHFALCFGLSLFLSALNVFFRDTEHLLGVGLLAWFFLSPIVYPFSQIPLEYQRLAFLNPMVGIVTLYRGVFLSTHVVAPRLMAMSLSISWVVLAAGIALFQRMQARFGDEM